MTIALSSSVAAFADTGSDKNKDPAGHATNHNSAAAADAGNPFFAESTLPLHYPAVDQIENADFAPGFDRGMAEQLREVAAIKDTGSCLDL